MQNFQKPIIPGAGRGMLKALINFLSAARAHSIALSRGAVAFGKPAQGKARP